MVSDSVSYLKDPDCSHVSHSLQANAGTVLRIGHDRFLPHFFNLFFTHSSYVNLAQQQRFLILFGFGKTVGIKKYLRNPNDIFLYEARELDQKPVRLMINKC
jgi:hypothetical protein